jgi:ribosomal protein L37E
MDICPKCATVVFQTEGHLCPTCGWGLNAKSSGFALHRAFSWAGALIGALLAALHAAPLRGRHAGFSDSSTPSETHRF